MDSWVSFGERRGRIKAERVLERTRFHIDHAKLERCLGGVQVETFTQAHGHVTSDLRGCPWARDADVEMSRLQSSHRSPCPHAPYVLFHFSAGLLMLFPSLRLTPTHL